MLLKDEFAETAAQLIKNYDFKGKITPENVFQKSIPENRNLAGEKVREFFLPGSGIKNSENFKKLVTIAKEGKSCLLFPEHYGNLDFSAIIHLIEDDPSLGVEAANAIIGIQGVKLSETSDNMIPSAFASAYDTLVIYPSRSIDSAQTEAEREEIRKVSTPINHAAMKCLIEQKHAGRIILVFPTGTRYRPWDPSSKKGVREVYSYLKTFDYICFVAINGNCLVPCREENMEHDELVKDVVHLTFSEPIKGKDFKHQQQKTLPIGGDIREHVVNQIMGTLEKMHNEAEEIRRKNPEAVTELPKRCR